MLMKVHFSPESFCIWKMSLKKLSNWMHDPSDSIVLAFQMDQPIHVSRKVLDNVEDMTEIPERILRKQD